MKKSKRQLRKESARQMAPGTASRVGNAPRTSASPYEFNPDYSYVVKDLRRIGMLAGTFIAILVALSFFLR